MNRIRYTLAQKGAWLSTIALVAAALQLGDTALAQVTPKPPERMTYQGFIAGSDGVALANAAPKNYDVIFRIYDAESAGTVIWGEQQTVTVDKGYFSVLLGEGAPVNGIPNAGVTLSSLFNSASASDRYVAFTVKGIGSGGADVDILPRVRLMSSPYAFLASRALVANLAETATTATTATTASTATTALTAGTATNTFFANAAIKLVQNSTSGTELAGANILSTNALDIIGVGTNAASRKINFYNDGGATFSGVTFHNQGIRVTTNSFLEFGYGSAKPTDPLQGMIGLKQWSSDSLDVMGGGWPRKLRVWAEGGMILGGTLNIGPNPAAPTPWPLNIGYGVSTYSMWAQNFIAAQGFVAISDRRVKDIVGVSDSAQDLVNLRKIRVMDYKMKMNSFDPQRINKGVIAQELQEVLPNATRSTTNLVPTPVQEAVGVEANAIGKPVVLHFATAHGFKKDDVIRLELDGKESEVRIEQVADEKTLSFIGVSEDPKKVRIVGRQVDDFMNVEYQQVYMTAVSALQEVDRRLQVVEQREARVAELEKKAARVETLEHDVAELRKLVADIKAATKKATESAAVAAPSSPAVASAR